MSHVTPYGAEGTKKEQVARMFDNISGRYDFLNRFLSVGIDKSWRRKLVKSLKRENPSDILDVATGTGDLAIAIGKAGNYRIHGIDISEGMLEVGREKIRKKHLDNSISLQYGDSEEIPFDNAAFDAVTVAFGVRNFENPLAGLAEIQRVLRPGGRIYVLEFSKPRRFPVKQFYGFYFKYILPWWGRMISKDTSAYTYLPASVDAFPDGERFTALMEKAGFSSCSYKLLTFGIASIYTGIK